MADGEINRNGATIRIDDDGGVQVEPAEGQEVEYTGPDRGTDAIRESLSTAALNIGTGDKLLNKVLSDSGDTFDNVGDAISDAENYVLVGVGTFSSFDVSRDDMFISGFGPATLIDGGFTIAGDRTTVSRLQATDGAESARIEDNSTRAAIRDVVSQPESAGQRTMRLAGEDMEVTGCTVLSDGDESALRVVGSSDGLILDDNRVEFGISISGSADRVENGENLIL